MKDASYRGELVAVRVLKRRLHYSEPLGNRATGRVTAVDRGKQRCRRQEFLAFLKQLDQAYPDQELHLVMDNYAVHKTPR